MPSCLYTCWHKFEGKGHFMIIGYGRTSTIEQVAGLEAQIRDLKAAGAEKLFRENVSSVAPRQQLDAAIEFAREGDTLVVTKIDRLARSVRHLCEIVDRLQAKGVALRILNMNLDTNDATGKLMLQIIGSIAEFERSIMLSRQLEGIAKAKAEGKYRGGIPTARAKAAQVFALVDAGKTRAEAAEELGISIRSVFRILRTRKDAEKAPVASPIRTTRTRPQVSAYREGGRQSPPLNQADRHRHNW
jgi:DNA invertase Pin-like site-specific DNA recombinase